MFSKKSMLFRVLVSVLLVSVLTLSIPVYASDLSYNQIEVEKQEQIDALFSELNDIALEKKLLQMTSGSAFLVSPNSVGEMNSLASQEASIEAQLSNLGVKKIKSSDLDDIERLNEIVNSSSSVTSSGFDFSMLTDVYSIYDYSGNYTINGVSYEYEYYRVVDNKGYVDTALTVAELITPITEETTILSSLLDYNFSYGLSAFLGNIPGYALADWTMGNVFAFLEGLNGYSPVVATNNNGIYAINMISVTTMTYYYINVMGQWNQCGSRASEVSFARSDSLSANINGVAYSESETLPVWSTSVGNSWSWYLERFLSFGFPTHHDVGEIDIERNGSVVYTFVPAFISNPYGLI